MFLCPHEIVRLCLTPTVLWGQISLMLFRNLLIAFYEKISLSKGQSSEVVVLWSLCDNRSAFGFVGKLVATCFLVVTNLSIHPSRLSIKSTVMVWKEERLSVFAVWQPVKEKVPLRGIEGGFILSLSGACFGCLRSRQHRNGLGVRADLRSCWEWYQKHFLFYRPSSPMLSVPHISKLSYSGSDNSKFLIPAFNISLPSSARSTRAPPDKEVILSKNEYNTTLQLFEK